MNKLSLLMIKLRNRVHVYRFGYPSREMIALLVRLAVKATIRPTVVIDYIRGCSPTVIAAARETSETNVINALDKFYARQSFRLDTDRVKEIG